MIKVVFRETLPDIILKIDCRQSFGAIQACYLSEQSGLNVLFGSWKYKHDFCIFDFPDVFADFFNP